MFEHDDDIRELTDQGLSLRAIAAKLQVSSSTVGRARARLGISRPSARHMTDAERTRAAELLDDGVTLTEVARTLGRDVRTVSTNLPHAPRLTRAERARLGLLTQKLSNVGNKPLRRVE